MSDLIDRLLEHGTPDCQHNWTVTSACPLCLRGRIVQAAARIRELEAERDLQEVSARKYRGERDALRALLRDLEPGVDDYWQTTTIGAPVMARLAAAIKEPRT